MGADRPVTAGSGLPDRRGWAPGGAQPPGRGGRDPVCHPQRVRVAGAAGRLPADRRTVYGLFQRWHARGVTIALHDALRAAARRAAGRDTEPTAAVIDSQSVRAAATVPKASRGWDNAKKVN